jgi:hypothetical protein
MTLAAFGQRRVKLRAVAVPAPALDLGERGSEPAAPCTDAPPEEPF